MSIELQRPVRYFSVEAFEAGFELGLALAEFADVVLTQDGVQSVVVMSVAAYDRRAADITRSRQEEAGHESA